jgi:hypothetical protein
MHRFETAFIFLLQFPWRNKLQTCSSCGKQDERDVLFGCTDAPIRERHDNFGKSRVVLNGILCFGMKIQTEKHAKLSTPLLIRPSNKKKSPTQVDNVVWQRRPFQMAGTLGIIH